MEEAKVKKSIKQVAKKGDAKICKMLAKELVRSQRHKNRLHASKAQLNSIVMQLEHQLGMSFCPACAHYKYTHSEIAILKVAGTLQKSGEVMKLVNQLVRLPEISQAMQQMSMEMVKVYTYY